MLNLKKIQDFVSMLFYQHGLLCATYPFAYIFGVITINLFMCYPLLKLPLPGNAPLQFVTPTDGYSVPPAATILEDLSSDANKGPRWYFGSPVAYIQQIVVKAAILPWDSGRLINSDLLRSSLFTAFELLEHIDNYQLQNNISGGISLADVCLRVAEVVSDEKVDGLLPEYNCLELSPVRFWKQDKQRFMADKDLISTMFRKRGMLFDTSPSVRDILFGVPWVKKYHLNRRRRVISYAVTIALREYNHLFLTGLQEKLVTLYPQSFASNVSQIEHLVHIHYHGHNFIVEYTPLIFAYIVLFLYLYFSVRKIEMVKSKWGLALSAMVTVVASLLMSVSLCLFFGLTPSLSGSEIFPYLVVIIGLENNLVITKSVVTTPVHLEVKLRIAQGLQKEGWYIFKNLMTELLVLAFGFLTFVPAIQEFCLFAVLALGSDFFLQMFFFATVLSVDIRRMELSDLHRPSMHEAFRFDSVEFKSQGDMHCPVMGRLYPPVMQPGMNGSQKPMQPLQLDSASALKLVPPMPSPASALEICDDLFYMDLDDERLPRRMRLLHFWARYRILQRGIMICVLIWIFLIVFKTGLVEELDEISPIYLNKDLDLLSPNSFASPLEHQKSGENITDYSNMFVDGAAAGKSFKEEPNRSSLGSSNVFQDSLEQWRYLSSNHWLTLLGYYNISLSGRYLTILPSIHLSIGVSPEEAIGIRHPSETRFDPPQHPPSWDPNGQFTTEPNQSSSLIQRLVRYPRTKTEFVITILLGIASFFLLVLIVLSMYKCMCSRNYAKWRSSWQRRLRKANQYYKQIRESVPLVLNGHIQEVECIITDGQRIISSCLGGEIRVWDFGSGECLVAIDRAKAAARRQAALFRTGQRHSSSLSDGVDQSTSEAPVSHPSSIPVPSIKSRHQHTSLSSSFGNDDLHVIDQTQHHSRHRSVDFALASIIPDLTETIDTDFKNSARNRQEQDRSLSSSGADENCPNLSGDASSPQQRLLSNGYDFTHFESYFEEHRKMKQEEELYVLRKRGMKHRNSSSKEDFVGASSPDALDNDADSLDCPTEDCSSGDNIYVEVPAAIWCLACDENIIVAGCGNGTVEFWDARNGTLQCMHQQNKSGVIGVCLSNSRVMAARIDGTLDFLQYFSNTHNAGHTPPSAMHRSSLSGRSEEQLRSGFSEAVAHCVLSASIKAHQQSINMISARGRHVVTASQDHTLKVYRIDDGLCLYTLHGHTAPVTTLHIDAEMSYGVVSGSADASVRVWDIQVGTCIHKLNGHTGGVTSVVCSPAHVVSIGMDDRLCIWDRSKGHLIHCVQLEAGYCNTVAMLTRHLIITGGQGSLHLWDVHKGRLLRALSLSDHDASVFIHQLLVVNNSFVVCDFGPQLRVVQFTPVLEKDD